MTTHDKDNIHCPVCGYYCLGNGGVECIDKPSMVKGNHAAATHDKDKIIAAALKIGISISTMHGQELHKLMPISDAKTLEAFYAIAFEAGRQAEREECAGICDMFGEREMHPAECAGAIRARGDTK